MAERRSYNAVRPTFAEIVSTFTRLAKAKRAWPQHITYTHELGHCSRGQLYLAGPRRSAAGQPQTSCGAAMCNPDEHANYVLGIVEEHHTYVSCELEPFLSQWYEIDKVGSWFRLEHRGTTSLQLPSSGEWSLLSADELGRRVDDAWDGYRGQVCVDAACEITQPHTHRIAAPGETVRHVTEPLARPLWSKIGRAPISRIGAAMASAVNNNRRLPGSGHGTPQVMYLDRCDGAAGAEGLIRIERLHPSSYTYPVPFAGVVEADGTLNDVVVAVTDDSGWHLNSELIRLLDGFTTYTSELDAIYLYRSDDPVTARHFGEPWELTEAAQIAAMTHRLFTEVPTAPQDPGLRHLCRGARCACQYDNPKAVCHSTHCTISQVHRPHPEVRPAR